MGKVTGQGAVLRNMPGNHRRAVLLPLGLLLLCMAVFGWGLQYKLSLYKSKDSISHLAPEAKLLSQKERPAAVHAPVQPQRIPAWPVVLLVVFTLGLLQAAARYLRFAIRETVWPPLQGSLRALFIRPPPQPSFSL
jgi:hypothetical protein